MRHRLGIFALLVSLFSAQAFAVDNFDLTTLTGLNDESVTSMLRTVAIGSDHRAYNSASTLGLLGFDLGMSVTAISVPTEFSTALALASGTPAANVPTLIPVPKLSIHKGLPGNIDLGFSYASAKDAATAQTLFTLWGLDAKWGILSGMGPLPAVAARFSMSSSDLWFLKTHTYAIDAIVSKNLFLIDPYVGAGLKYWSGDLQIPVSLAGTPITTFKTGQSGMSPHIYAGLPIKLLLLRATFEVDYSLSGLTTYGMKASLAF